MSPVAPSRPFWMRSARTDAAMTHHDGWAYRTLKHDYPGCMGLFSAYVLTLEPESWPHDVHGHVDEEILIPLTSGVTMVESGATQRINPGQVVFHAPWHQHTHTGAPEGGTSILALKWRVPGTRAPHSHADVLVANLNLSSVDATHGIRRRRIWTDRPLTAGGTLTMESMVLPPGRGYPRHAHADHDLVLIVMSGQLTDYAIAMPAPAVIYYPAGTPHGALPFEDGETHLIALEFTAPPSMPWLARP